MLPNFLVIGALKAGTTSLYDYLKAHPQIFMPARKELRFFVEQKNWGLGRDWYESQFAGAEDALAVGEASPSYTMVTSFPGVPARIAEMIPDARLVYILRHPVERMRSHFLQRVIDGTEDRRPDDAFLQDLDYLHTSRYAFQLEHYLEHFPAPHILLITSEDLRADRLRTLQRVFAFLGVDPSHVPATIGSEKNQSARVRVPTSPLRGLQRMPGWSVARRIAPESFRRWFGRKTSKPLTIDGVVISAEVERRIVEALRPDVHRLRAHMPPDFEGWGLL